MIRKLLWTSITTIFFLVTLSTGLDGDTFYPLQNLTNSCTGPFGTYGAIGALYNSYTDGLTQINPLGKPVSYEKHFVNDTDICNGADVDKYQEFEHGSIYYVASQKSAFALFNQVDVKYKDIKAEGTLGFPTTSEIGDATRYPYSCRAYFEGGMIFCKDAYMSVGVLYWSGLTNYGIENILKRDYPALKMPFKAQDNDTDNKGEYSAGPHSWIVGDIHETYPEGQGSGLDISGPAMDVVAMASGTIIDIYPDPVRDDWVDCTTLTKEKGLGCWVAIRHDFSGTVMVYGHIQPHLTHSYPEPIRIGAHIKTGNLLGNTTNGFIGNSDGPHVHIEYRNGIKSCETNCVVLRNNAPIGRPIDWHGVVIDDTLISGASVLNSDSSYNYDGTAVRVVGEFTKTKYTQSEVETQFSNLLEYAEWKFLEYKSPIERTTKTWLTKEAWATCQASSDNLRCEEVNVEKSYDNTIFSVGGGLISTNTNVNGITVENSGSFTSTNNLTDYDPRYEPPYPNPQPTPTPGGPSSNCDNPSLNGVYFYENTNYTGDCYYTTSDTANFGLTTVGNDRLSSVRIVGDYKVRLYEDIYYTGRYDELNSSDSNLDIRSLGDQYSSATVSEKLYTCPTDGREGVYMYSEADYKGDCLFSTVDIPFFGDTVIGDNDLDSIRFIGHWDAKLYEKAFYEGRYDYIGSNDSNLSDSSLGDQFSSAKLIRNTPDPTPTLPPNTTILLSPSINNGGFESGSMSGWSQTGGAFVIDTMFPHSGSFYVKGTSAEEAKFYRYFDVSTYQTAINEGRASSSYYVYVDVGDSEEYKYSVKFQDSAGNTLDQKNTGWSWHDGGYDQREGSMTVPINTSKVLIEFSMRRTANDFTDCDVDDFYLDLTIQPTSTPTPEPTPPSAPDCEKLQEDNVLLYDYTYCNDYAGKIPFGVENSLYNLVDISWDNRISSIYIPEGTSLLLYEGSGGTGQYQCLNSSVNDLNQIAFDDGRTLSNQTSSIVYYLEPDCPQINASNPVINTNPLAGETTTAEYYLQNISGRTLNFDGILAGIHGPFCETWDCENTSDYPWAVNITLQLGETYHYKQERAFNVVSDQYLYEFLTLDSYGVWKSYFPTQSMSVSRGLEIIEPITLNPMNPSTGDQVTAEYKVKNFGDRPITIPYLMVIAKGPNCSSWDCPEGCVDFPWVKNITLNPGEEYGYVQSRTFNNPGDGYFADAAFGDNNVWWYLLPSNVRYHFSVDGYYYNFLPAISH